jgi:hypothetical protein
MRFRAYPFISSIYMGGGGILDENRSLILGIDEISMPIHLSPPIMWEDSG